MNLVFVLISLIVLPSLALNDDSFDELGRLISDKEYEKALFHLDKILEKTPKDDVFLSLKGSILYELGRPYQAIEYFDNALEINPQLVSTLNHKGYSLYNLGMYEQAIIEFDKALAIDPNYVRALNNKGISLAKLGKYSDALSLFDNALEINPSYVKALSNKGYTLYNLGKFEEAIIFFDKALVIEPTNTQVIKNKENAIAVQDTIRSLKNGVLIGPTWIKNNADWWNQGIISDDDFVKGIQFLVEQGIIKVQKVGTN